MIKKFQFQQPRLRGKTQFWNPKCFFKFDLTLIFTLLLQFRCLALKVKTFEVWRARLEKPPLWNSQFFRLSLFLGSGYFASRGKIAPCYFAIWRQNIPNGYFAARAKIALSLILIQTLTLTQTITLILTLIPNLALTLTLTQTLAQTEEKHYFASRGKIGTSLFLLSTHFEILIDLVF